MHPAVAVAYTLTLSILVAGAACWALTGLKLLALSRSDSLRGMARAILGLLQIRPGLPLVAWTPRRAVPWGLIDLVAVIVLYIVAIFAAQLLFAGLGWLPQAANGKELTLADKGLLVWMNIVVSLGLLAVALPLIVLRTGANWRDLGFSWREAWSDLKLGAIAFVMLAPPVYAIQGTLHYYWKPSKHPLLEMFKESPDAGFFALLFVAAAVVAPIFEELVFRVLLQGFLERAFSICRRAYNFQDQILELVFGTSSQNAPLQPAVVADSTLLQPFTPAGELNPYLPPAILLDSTETPIRAELADEAMPPPLTDWRAFFPIALSALIFALMHYSHGPDWVALTLLAAGMGYLYQRTHRLLPSLVVHVLLNSLSMFGLWVQIYALPPDLKG
ncbi:MAG: CPBP family intramembrane glutamic endopeptidase [Pirellulaceae bacterium]